MRQIALDIETTGLSRFQGHKIIEIGCVQIGGDELQFHTYVYPGRDIDDAAYRVHGITLKDTEDSPMFYDIADDLIEFIDGAELIIHKAEFDIGFLNHELTSMDNAPGEIEDFCTIVDTWALAKKLHPKKSPSLDNLCNIYGVDSVMDDWHGAMIDATRLAALYPLLLEDDEQYEH